MKERWIKASEIGEYLYCQRAWWFRLQGFSSANVHELDQGTRLHKQHYSGLKHSVLVRAMAFIFVVIALLILMIQIVL